MTVAIERSSPGEYEQTRIQRLQGISPYFGAATDPTYTSFVSANKGCAARFAADTCFVVSSVAAAVAATDGVAVAGIDRGCRDPWIENNYFLRRVGCLLSSLARCSQRMLMGCPKFL